MINDKNVIKPDLRDHFNILSDANCELNASLSVDAIRTILIKYALKLLDADAGAVGLLKNGHMIFTEYVSAGEVIPVNYEFEPGYGVPGWVTEHLAPYISHNAAADPQVIPDIQQRLGFSSLINVPLIDHDNKLMGCLEVHHCNPASHFHRDDIETLSGLAACAAIAMRNALTLTTQQKALHELTQTKERYRNLVETTTDWIWEVDHTGTYTYVSPNVSELLGYQQHEIIGRTPFDFMPVDEAQRIREIFLTEIISSQKPFSQLVNINQHKNGTHIVLETSGIPVNDEDGNLMGYRGIDRDITARAKTNDELLKAKQNAEIANQAKSEFLSHMSHELRTPLNAILGFAQVLELDCAHFSANHKDNIQEILNAGHHLLNLINDMLDLAKIEAGKLQVVIEPVNVNALIEQCLTLVTPQSLSLNLTLHNGMNANLYQVSADPVRLKQVFLNILSNAVKYNIENGSITVECDVKQENHLCIRFIDTGKGLTQEEIDRLFTPFIRLKSADNIEGTGIGLVITRHLIELMGGRLGIESTPGKGSIFWLELRLAN